MATKGLAFKKQRMELYEGWNDKDKWNYDIFTLSNVFTLGGLGDWTLKKWLFE